MKLYHFIFYLSLSILYSCSPQKVEQNVVTGKDNLQKQHQETQNQSPIKLNKQQALIKDLNIIMLPDFPVQVNIAVVVELKDNCTTVNEIYQNQRDDSFLIEILETRQKQRPCEAQPILSEYVIPLDVRNLSAGHYTVYVNQKSEHFELLVDN